MRSVPPDPAGVALLSELDEPLSEGEDRFCSEYLANGGNGTEAYIQAGYTKNRRSAKANASRMLKRPRIILEIARRREALAKRCDASLDDIMRELQTLGFSRITDFVKWGPNFVRLRSQKELEKDPALKRQLAAIKSLSDNDGSIKLKLHDKVGPLTQLAKMLGWVPPRDPSLVSSPEATQTSAVQVILEGGPTGLEIQVKAAK